MKKLWNQVSNKIAQMYTKLKDNTGEGYVDTGIKILIAIVIGALLLAGLYTIFNDTLLPTVTQRIKDMFDYAP